MKKQRGETQVQLEVEDREFLDRLLTATNKPYEFAAGHRRLFTRLGEWDNDLGDWVRTEHDTTTMPRKRLLANVNAARKATQKADQMLAEWQESIKAL